MAHKRFLELGNGLIYPRVKVNYRAFEEIEKVKEQFNFSVEVGWKCGGAVSPQITYEVFHKTTRQYAYDMSSNTYRT